MKILPLLGEPGAQVTGFDGDIAGAKLLLASDELFQSASADAISYIVRQGALLPLMTSALVDLTRVRSDELNDDVGSFWCAGKNSLEVGGGPLVARIAPSHSARDRVASRAARVCFSNPFDVRVVLGGRREVARSRLTRK